MEYSCGTGKALYMPDIAEGNINFALMKAIFEDKAENVIIELYTQDVEWEEENDVIDIANSWMYRILSEWADDINHPYRGKARTLIFNY